DISKGVASATGSELIGNLAANIAAGVGGAALGGTAGAAMGSNVHLYNQTVDDERALTGEPGEKPRTLMDWGLDGIKMALGLLPSMFGGGGPPAASPGAVLVNGEGQALAAGAGSAAFQPDNATLNDGGNGGNGRQANPSKADSPVWQSLDSAGNGVKTDGKQFYEWDYTHNDIEVYDKRGRHVGSADPVTGELYKPPVPGRKLNR
ncbi:hypothetical protein EHZ19_31630, partial [Paraburkholderia bannensis]